jgi:chromosome segregation ATPase
MSPPRNRLEFSAVGEEMEALNQCLIEKDREISALQETIQNRKHTRKEKDKDKERDTNKDRDKDKEKDKEKEREMKVKHYALQMEVMNLLTIVQSGREELSKKKSDLQDIARLVNDYKMREASAVARFAEISRQLDLRDSAADRMDTCLKVMSHASTCSYCCWIVCVCKCVYVCMCVRAVVVDVLESLK